MLTEQQVTDLFREFLPPDTYVTFQDLPEFAAAAMRNPFVQFQIGIGIYNPDTFADDFLGFAKSIVALRRVVVCLPLLHNHVDGLPHHLVEAYVRHVAAHEAHHFEHDHVINTSDPIAQANREKECNRLIAERYPDLEALRAEVDTQSATIQRVYQRIQGLRKANSDTRTRPASALSGAGN